MSYFVSVYVSICCNVLYVTVNVMYKCVYVYTCMCVCVYASVYMYVCVCVCMYASVCMYVLCMYVFVCVCVYASVCTVGVNIKFPYR